MHPFLNRRSPSVALLAVLLTGGCAAPDDRAGAGARTGGPLGRVDFGVACDASVRDDFDLALAQLHHMTYPVAAATFGGVIERDSHCAMAYWASP